MSNHLNIKTMKSTVIFILALIAVFRNSYASPATSFVAEEQVNADTMVKQNIHGRIMDAFMNSFAVQNNSKMLSFIDELSSLYNRSNNPIFLYWKGYALYYNSITYLKNAERDKSYDYYTPETYNRVSKVEEYALKALSLPAQKIADPDLPSWGRQESYELLTNYYLKKKNLEQAKKYIEQGLLEYPDSYTLNYNRSKL